LYGNILKTGLLNLLLQEMEYFVVKRLITVILKDSVTKKI